MVAAGSLAGVRCFLCAGNNIAEHDPKCLGHSKQGFDGGKPLPLLHPHHHRSAQASPPRHLIDRQFLPRAFLFEKMGNPRYHRIALGTFWHKAFCLREQRLDSACDYRQRGDMFKHRPGPDPHANRTKTPVCSGCPEHLELASGNFAFLSENTNEEETRKRRPAQAAEQMSHHSDFASRALALPKSDNPANPQKKNTTNYEKRRMYSVWSVYYIRINDRVRR